MKRYSPDVDGYMFESDDGYWVRTKFCFVSCEERCDCMPPNGQHYSAAHDESKRLDISGERP